MNEGKIIFCGNNSDYLPAEITKYSNSYNGGNAFRIPSLIRRGKTLIAVADRQSCADDWGYIEPVIRRSVDGGETWSSIEVIAYPPARKTMYSPECFASAFYIDPCMAIAPNGDIILIIDFFPECKGIHAKKLLDRKKEPYAMYQKKLCNTLYDRDGNFYVVTKSGKVLDSKYNETSYTVADARGSLFDGEKYIGNIFLNGKSPSDVNEANAATTFGSPLKAPKRNYVYMFKSSDFGRTWSKSVDITANILSKSDGVFLGTVPGRGLTTKKGRIVMPLYSENGQSVSIYSIDNGETWLRMTQHPYSQNTDEWQMIQAPDGAILGLGRQKSYGKTPLCVSYDDGKTWEKRGKTDLYAPKCQKSVISIGNYVFCSHPSEKKRENGVITVGKFTKQKGVTAGINWYTETAVNNGYFAYSCLERIDNDYIGLLYEAYPSSLICFKKFKIRDLI